MSNYVQSTNFATKDSLPSGDPLKIVKGTEINTEFANIAIAVATKADLVSPSFTTPALGTPSAGVLTNCTGLPMTSGVTGVLPVANGGTGVTTSTGSGNNVLSTSPTLVTPVLGTPTSGTLTNCTGLPLTTGVTGQLPALNGGTGATGVTGTGLNVLSISPALFGVPTATNATFGDNSTRIATTAFVQAALQALHPVGSIYINATNATNPGTLLGFGTWVAFGAGRVPVGFNASNALFDTAEETGGSADAILVSHTHTATSVVTDAGHTHDIQVSNLSGASVDDRLGGSGADYGIQNTNDSGTTVKSAQANVTVATTVDSAGSSGTNANYQPYIVVYMWKRTA